MRLHVKTKKELRKFGLVMTVPLALIGGYLWWKERGAYPIVLGTGAFFLISGLLYPRILRPIERIWMKFAELVGAIMTRVILSIAFFLIITPMGLLLRVLGKDLLHIRRGAHEKSFWIPVETDGPATHPENPD